jgi:hypothetical protein
MAVKAFKAISRCVIPLTRPDGRNPKPCNDSRPDARCSSGDTRVGSEPVRTADE